MDFDHILRVATQENIDAICFCQSRQPTVRSGRHNIRLDCPPIGREEILAGLQDVLAEEHIESLKTVGGNVAWHPTNFPFSCRVVASEDGLEVTCIRDTTD